MPTILRLPGLRFDFYSDEGDESPHIHVDCGDTECKFWLEPVELSRNRGVAPATVRKIGRMVFEHKEFFLE